MIFLVWEYMTSRSTDEQKLLLCIMQENDSNKLPTDCIFCSLVLYTWEMYITNYIMMETLYFDSTI